ncbi:Crp/Fnr family transcriptional regulator [Actinomycetospora succinea]|uniref:Crp/Fnr family transcriptional regulator n=1 Tax=Actinomycetospora succinea TaxID=663603 RepID=A0A4R6UZF2_9PSEU|nr:Crp/Fnr family transcriptional regulator [Actinomycetospora succinea]TDQ51015.1 Crp/Fnr family transcriptional regulator [Actinomycetospora succinea]
MRPSVQDLREIEWFRRLPPEQVAQVAQACAVVTLARDAVLYRSGAAADAFFVLLRGRVGAWRGDPTGPESMLYFVADRRHESLCLENVVADIPYFATMRGLLDDTRVLRIPASVLPAMLEADRELGIAIARHIAQRLQTFTEQMTDLGSLPVVRRVAKFLLASRQHGSDLVVVTLRQAELASRLGAARQSVNQALATLAQRGIIATVGRGVYQIRDHPGLVALARGGPAPGPGSRARGVVGSAGARDA